MGLKILHNGNISDYSGPEYDPGSYGRARLRIKINDASTAEYGLTSDLTASQYCKASFKVNGSTLRIGRRETRTSESAYTVSETLYTYTYQTTTTYQAGAYNYTYSGYSSYSRSGYETINTTYQSNYSWQVNTTKVSSYTYYSGYYSQWLQRTTQWRDSKGGYGALGTYQTGPSSSPTTAAAQAWNTRDDWSYQSTTAATRTTYQTSRARYTTDIRDPKTATRQQNTTTASWGTRQGQTTSQVSTADSHMGSATSYTTRQDNTYTITDVYSRSYYTYEGNQYTTLNSDPWYSSSIGSTRRTRPAEYTTHNFNV